METDENAELCKFLPRLYFFLRALRDGGWVSCIAGEGLIRIKQPHMKGESLCPIQAIVMMQTGKALNGENLRTDLFVCKYLGISMAVLYRVKDILEGCRNNALDREVYDKIRETIGMAAVPMKPEPALRQTRLWIIRVPTSTGAN